jgi:hypothetical protein
MRYLVAAIAVLGLAACGQRDTDAGPGGVSVGEARALDEAAAMLDRQRLPADAVTGAASTAEPSTASPSPTPSPEA